MRSFPSRLFLLLPLAGCACSPQYPPTHDQANAQNPAAAATRDRPVNRLAHETSPYLRQHQHNPVDWYPWGQEALQKAAAEDKPIFLSIGYSACHWCHVMERESFEDPAIAALMNEHFVCIKVDREERPDLDDLYMTAVQAMTGQGGWPMSVWLTPDGKPFYGGTYFPPDDRWGRPGFARVLQHLGQAWRQQRQQLLAGSEELAAHLRKVLDPPLPKGQLSQDVVTALRQASERSFDAEHGGFAGGEQAPKFPHASELQVLLRLWAQGDAQAGGMVTTSLDHMLRGGIYDQLGGGFHRYSTDRQWLVPHFEKMLYDNALLVPLYLEAFAHTGNDEYRRVAQETLDWLLREMQGPHGGFYSSQDADSEGEEGRFFVWDLAEVRQVCGDDAAVAEQRWGITAAGNWEGRNVLVLAADAAAIAPPAGGDAAAAIDRCRQRLLQARGKRPRPGTDDKVLTAWNALAISACAIGQQILGEQRYLQAAQRAADFALRELVRDGRCKRSWHSGRADIAGFLDDHAGLADALLTLFESDGDPRWLQAARQLLQTVQQHFAAPDGGFYNTADDAEQLLARSRSATESSTPSGMALAAQALLRGGLLLGDEALYGAGVRCLEANAGYLRQLPNGCASMVLALQFHLGEPREVVVAGEPGDPAAMALLQRAWRARLVSRVVAPLGSGHAEALAALSPVFAHKQPQQGRAAAYVCRRGACERPVTDPAALTLDGR